MSNTKGVSKKKPIVLKTDLSFDETLMACLMTKPSKTRNRKKKTIKKEDKK